MEFLQSKADILREVQLTALEWWRLVIRTERQVQILADYTDADLTTAGFTAAEISKVRIIQSVFQKGVDLCNGNSTTETRVVMTVMQKALNTARL